MANELGISTRTVKRRLQSLVAWNWLGIDKTKKRYYLRGLRKIHQMIGGRSRQGFVLNLQEDLKDKIRFQAKIAGGFLAHLARSGAFTKYTMGGRERVVKWRSDQTFSSQRIWHEVAANGIAKILNLGVSTAHKYRKMAWNCGFIEVKVHRKKLTKNQVQALKYSSCPADRKKFARIRKQRGRFLLDSTHWVRAGSIEFSKIGSKRKPRTRRINSASFSPSTDSTLLKQPIPF